jgi:hypothetical protein
MIWLCFATLQLCTFLLHTLCLKCFPYPISYQTPTYKKIMEICIYLASSMLNLMLYVKPKQIFKQKKGTWLNTQHNRMIKWAQLCNARLSTSSCILVREYLMAGKMVLRYYWMKEKSSILKIICKCSRGHTLLISIWFFFFAWYKVFVITPHN